MSSVCPHSRRTLKTRSDIEPPNRSDECPVCLEPYFSKRADGTKAFPVLLHCSHVCCEPCLMEHFRHSLKCMYSYCTSTAEHALLRDTCDLCVAWVASGPQGATKFAAMVEPKWIIASLTDYFKDLEESYDQCKLTKKNRKRLFDFVKDNLRQFEGHVFEAKDLAEIFDPLLYVIDRETWLNSSFGACLTPPAPATLATIPVNDRNIALYLNGEEPWITTVLRVWAHNWVKEEGKEMDLDFNGYLTQRQIRSGVSESEITWPIKRILNHRLIPGGGVEYLVQWLGYQLPRFNTWVSSADIHEDVHKDYDAEHGLWAS